MATKTESEKPKGLVDRERLRPIHTRVRERHAGDPKGAVIHTRGQVRQVDGFFVLAEYP